MMIMINSIIYLLPMHINWIHFITIMMQVSIITNNQGPVKLISNQVHSKLPKSVTDFVQYNVQDHLLNNTQSSPITYSSILLKLLYT